MKKRHDHTSIEIDPDSPFRHTQSLDDESIPMINPTHIPIYVSPLLFKSLDLLREGRSFDELFLELLDFYTVPPHQHPPAWTIREKKGIKNE